MLLLLRRWLWISVASLWLLVSCTSDTGGSGGLASAPAAASSAMPAGLMLPALRAMQQAPGHDFAPEGEALRARVGQLGQEAWAEVGRDGVVLTPIDGEFVLGVRTAHLGREGASVAPPPVVGTRAEEQEAVLDRGEVEERYLAGPLGLEQSYRIESRPRGSGPLAITVAFDGLSPEAVSSRAVALQDAEGATRAVYRDLWAVDAEGRELQARMAVSKGEVTLVVEDQGAAYPVVVDPLIWVQEAKLLAADGATDDWFGWSVSMSGDTALIGATSKSSNTGAAYVFVRSGTSWTQQAKLVANDGVPNDLFGSAVSVSGDTALVGANGKSTHTGAAYVFARSGTIWTQWAKLVANDGAMSDQFGASVSVSSNTAVVGARNKDNGVGAAYIFVRSGTSWIPQAKLWGNDIVNHAYFGRSVSVSGDTVLVGSDYMSSAVGAAYVYVRSGTSWTQQAKLMASDPHWDSFGCSVSVSGNTAIVGAYAQSSNTGAAYVFARSGTSWTQQAKLLAGDSGTSEWFGYSVSVAGDTALVGAHGKSSNTGAAYVFARSGTSWTQQAKLLASDGAANDLFGSSVAMSGNTALLGAYGKSSHTGAAYVFQLRKGQGDPCGGATECSSGFCVDGVCCNTACNAGPCDACSVAAGASAEGTCALLTGPICDDGNPCTLTDACQAGICHGSNLKTCTALDPCHVAGSCDPTTGACSNPNKADGTACDDSDACTQADTCQGGACVGGNPKTCAALDQCHVAGSCDPTTGVCSNPNKADGTACSDSDPCTQTDTCQGGACIAGAPVTCTALDQCHVAGTCDSITGACSNPSKADGAGCDDGDACTQVDTCQGGACGGGNPVVCVALDQCHTAGTCNSITGACSNPNKTNGAACDDGDACTQVDTCQGGACAGGNAVVCVALDQCHTAGTCNSITGACSNPNETNGAACDDGDPNTVGDLCTSGTCAGVDHCAGVTCPDPDECHQAGSCVDHATGTCDNPAKADGTACSLGTCQSGVCSALPDAGTGGTGTGGTGTGGTGTGGTGTGGTGTGGTSSTSSSASSSSSSGNDEGVDSSCSCRTAGGETLSSSGWIPAFGLMLILVRRRRRAA